MSCCFVLYGYYYLRYHAKACKVTTSNCTIRTRAGHNYDLMNLKVNLRNKRRLL